MSSHTPCPNRRQVLGGVVLAGSLAVTRADAAPRAALDLADPRARLEAYVKLRGSTAAQTVYFPYDGDIVLLRTDEDSVPLVGFRGMTKSVWRPDGDGGHHYQDYDVGLFFDRATGEALNAWRNPLTGETVEVMPYMSGPTGGHFRPGVASDDPYGHAHGRWMQAAGQVWQTSSATLSWPNPLSPELHPKGWSGARVRTSMSTVYGGRIADILDPDQAAVPSTLAWNDILSPSPWMRMGQRPVMCDWRMIGAKVIDKAELDPDLVAEVEAVFPGYVTRSAVWTTAAGGWTLYRDRFPQGEPDRPR